MNHWKVIFASLVIFVTGAITGHMVTKQRDSAAEIEKRLPGNPPPRPDHRRVWLIKRMQSELGLTQEQKEALDTALQESQKRAEALWKPVAPLMKEEYDRLQAGIQEILTPEQQDKLEELMETRRGYTRGGREGRRFRGEGRERSRPGPDGPPPGGIPPEEGDRVPPSDEAKPI